MKVAGIRQHQRSIKAVVFLSFREKYGKTNNTLNEDPVNMLGEQSIISLVNINKPLLCIHSWNYIQAYCSTL